MADTPERGRPPGDDWLTADAPSESLEEILRQQAESESAGEEPGPPAKPSAGETLKAAEQELEQMRDRHLRKIAEFDNFRKRSQREKEDYFRFALADFLREILPVLDNFERAMAQKKVASVDDYRQGVALIYKQFEEVLKKRGLREVPCTGPFDPNIHEAVALVPAEAPPGTILEVLQKGYFLQDKLLRPAFVKVAAAGPSTEEPEQEPGEGR